MASETIKCASNFWTDLRQEIHWNYKCMIFTFNNKSHISISCMGYFQLHLVDHADFVRAKWSYVLMGTRNLIEIGRFSSKTEFELSGHIFICEES